MYKLKECYLTYPTCSCRFLSCIRMICIFLFSFCRSRPITNAQHYYMIHIKFIWQQLCFDVFGYVKKNIMRFCYTAQPFFFALGDLKNYRLCSFFFLVTPKYKKWKRKTSDSQIFFLAATPPTHTQKRASALTVLYHFYNLILSSIKENHSLQTFHFLFSFFALSNYLFFFPRHIFNYKKNL